MQPKKDHSAGKLDRQARERLADWRTAEREESATTEASVERRRAIAKTRRARWGFEDATRAAGADHGDAPETQAQVTARTMRRFREATDAAAELQPDRPRKGLGPESAEQRDKRLADDAEIARELAED